ncbi:hypothetical protein R1sor_024795 [Riccia sorocarpa]|uniref:Uncharacterized protein n=1 Tax=Riccia sorocarpa TaxID=122646 RepID=A0ABD3GTY5_9MARC
MDLSEGGASAHDDVNPREGLELDGSTIAPSSQGESSSLKFNLEKHLDKYDGIQSPPLRRTGERTPQSRLSSALKHGYTKRSNCREESLKEPREHQQEHHLLILHFASRVASASHSQPNFTMSDMAKASERREHSGADSELKEADLEEITRREMADEMALEQSTKSAGVPKSVRISEFLEIYEI